MKKIHLICLCGLLVAMTANQGLAMKSLMTHAQIIEHKLALDNIHKSAPPTTQEDKSKPGITTHKLGISEITDYLIKYGCPDHQVESITYTLVTYIPILAHGSCSVFINLLKIMDRIFCFISKEKILDADESIDKRINKLIDELTNESIDESTDALIDQLTDELIKDPIMHKIDPDIIQYMHHLMMINKEKFWTRKDEMLEALCDTDALKQFKLIIMQTDYLKKKGYKKDTINKGQNFLNKYTDQFYSISEELEEEDILSLLMLIDWIRDKAIENRAILSLKKELEEKISIINTRLQDNWTPDNEATTNNQILSLTEKFENQIAFIIKTKLKSELPKVYTVLNNDPVQFIDRIIILYNIINKIIYQNKTDLSAEDQEVSKDIECAEDQEVSKDIECLEKLIDELQHDASLLMEEQEQFLTTAVIKQDQLISQLKNMQEYTHCFKSVFKKPEMFRPLLNAINKTLVFLDSKSNKDQPTLEELHDTIKKDFTTRPVSSINIKKLFQIVIQRKILDTDEIIEELDRMNRYDRELNVMACSKKLVESFDSATEDDITLDQTYSSSYLVEESSSSELACKAINFNYKP